MIERSRSLKSQTNSEEAGKREKKKNRNVALVSADARQR